MIVISQDRIVQKLQRDHHTLYWHMLRHFLILLFTRAYVVMSVENTLKQTKNAGVRKSF